MPGRSGADENFVAGFFVRSLGRGHSGKVALLPQTRSVPSAFAASSPQLAAARAAPVCRHSAALLLFALGAKAVVVVHAAGQAPGLWQGAWSLPALFGEDVLLGTLVAAALAGLRFVVHGRPTPGHHDRIAAVVYFTAAFYLALNVPLVFVLGSPLTYSLLHASGAALGDSIRHYLTPVNLSALLGLLLAAGLMPRIAGRLLHRRSGRAAAMVTSTQIGLALILVVLLLAGPAAVARVETRGLQRNPIITLAASFARRADARLDRGDSAPACLPFAPAPGPRAPTLDPALMPSLFAPRRSIVWVILESTGARFLSPYGGARETTPQLAALADQALIAARAYAAYPESIKGLYSMLCSRTPPPESEAAQYRAGQLPCASVAEALSAAGYRTGLFHAGHFAYLGMDAVVGGRGFATLADAATIPSAFKSSFGIDERATVEALLGWVDQGRASAAPAPFFAVYMPIAGHHPYHAPGPAARPFAERSARDEHRNDLHVVDEAVGQLRAGLATRGLERDLVYVVVGDHGEAFEEHPGNIGHALALYEENVRVPFFIALPGRLSRPRTLAGPVSLLDLGPTTLALAGLPALSVAEGQPLSAAAPARVIRFATEQAQRQVGLIDGRRKLILDRETGRARLYDLDTDPDERRDHAPAPSAEEAAFIAHHRACLGDS